jgi:predicted dehydrogenase
MTGDCERSWHIFFAFICMTKNKEGKLGIALVGLGKYSEGQLAPALQETKYCYLAGIVTGSEEKAKKWKKKYDIPDENAYSYDSFDSIKDNGSIDIVYVVTPPALHADYVVRAAQAGKHVICEKPLAVTIEDCDRMIGACAEAGVLFSVGYRLHFEPHNLEAMHLGQKKRFGAIKKIIAEHGMKGTEGWRLDKSLAGGGPLTDVGVYCIQAVCYVTGQEPIAVWAQEGKKKDPETYKEIEESLSWQMEMPDGVIAECRSSYSEKQNLLRVECERGWYELSPAYQYSGIKGKTSEGKMDFAEVNQQAKQMDDFAERIKHPSGTPVPGEMGKRDIVLIRAVYEAMASGRRVEV